MSELDEITNNKTVKQLESELSYQLSQGENLGGTICSHINDLIEKLKIESNMETITTKSTETMIFDMPINSNSLNGYSKIHRSLHFTNGSMERVVIALTEQELDLANNAPKMLEALKYVSSVIEKSDEWWIDSISHGGFDTDIIDNAIDFHKDSVKEEVMVSGRKRTLRERALLWMANYIHYDFGYITTKHNIVHFENLTVKEIETLYLEFNPNEEED